MPQRYGDAPLEAMPGWPKPAMQEVSSAAGYARRADRPFAGGTGARPGQCRCDPFGALAQLRKAGNRRSRKKKDLQREMLLEQQRRRAQERQCQREMLRLKAEAAAQKDAVYSGGGLSARSRH